MKIRFLSFLLLLSFTTVEAQSVIGLNDCIALGLERNFAIRIAKNYESISANNFTKGNAGYLPTVDLSSRYGGTLNNTIQNLADGSQNTTSGVHNTTAYAAIGLDLTIFDGFSVQTTYKKLDELNQLGALNTQMEVENLIADIVVGYYDYIQQVQTLKNIKYAVSLSRERLRIDEERYLLGSNSKLQVLQSRVYLNADSSSLSRQFETVKAAQIKLNTLMAAENLDAVFQSQDTSIQVNAALLYEQLLQQTLQKNTSLLIASKNKSISAYDKKLIESRAYPYLNFSTGYSYSRNDYSTGTYNNQSTNGMNYGLNLGITIYDGNNQKRSLKNSTLDLKNKELLYQNLEQNVRADLLRIYHAYGNNLRLIRLEEQNMLTAAENLEIALERYKLGSLSGIELREVQKSLLDAKESLLSIQYQTKLAEVSLQLIAGQIMVYFE